MAYSISIAILGPARHPTPVFRGMRPTAMQCYVDLDRLACGGSGKHVTACWLVVVMYVVSSSHHHGQA